ncbi:MAG TPA: hypothetical protein VGO68_14280 [Pyrinomonadaceae bacterium]|jgi:hypothetical protein|nr:hypothetical protein [Pyrinomonadaceae bacterium]
MTKRQVVWLLIRGAGLWFLLQSVEYSNTLTSTYLHVSQDPDLFSRSTGVFVQLILQAGLNLFLGVYCVRFGNLFFFLLNRENGDDENGDGDSGLRGSSTLGLP